MCGDIVPAQVWRQHAHSSITIAANNRMLIVCGGMCCMDDYVAWMLMGLIVG